MQSVGPLISVADKKAEKESRKEGEEENGRR